MSTTDRRRLILAAMATLVGVAGMAYALFAPLGRFLVETVDENGVATTSERGISAVAAGIEPYGIVLLAIAFLAFVSLPIAAWAVVRGSRSGRYALRLAAIYLVVYCLLGLMTIGGYLLPGAGLAFFAAITSDRRSGTKRSRQTQPAAAPDVGTP